MREICCDTWEIEYKMELHQSPYTICSVSSDRLKMDYSGSMNNSCAAYLVLLKLVGKFSLK